MIGFPLILADSEQDMSGFEPGPARLEQLFWQRVETEY